MSPRLRPGRPARRPRGAVSIACSSTAIPREPNRSKNADCGFTPRPPGQRLARRRARTAPGPSTESVSPQSSSSAGVRVDPGAQRSPVVHRVAEPGPERSVVRLHRASFSAGAGSVRLRQCAVRSGAARRPLVDEGGVGLQQVGAGREPLARRPRRSRCRRRRPGSVRSPTRARSSRSTSSERAPQRRARTGRRLRRASTCGGVRRSPSRLMVVLVATIPSRPERQRPGRRPRATSSSPRSGAIFTSSGTCRSVTVVGAPADGGRAAAASCSTACRSRRPGRVRRGDVDHEVVGVRREQAGCSSRSRRPPASSGTTLVLPMLMPSGRPARPVPVDAARGEPARDHLGAVVVEAHPVDHRAVGGQPEQPRLRVARLRLAGDRADLDEAEAERRPARRCRRRSCRSPAASPSSAGEVAAPSPGRGSAGAAPPARAGATGPARRGSRRKRRRGALARGRCGSPGPGRTGQRYGRSASLAAVSAQSCSERTPMSPARSASMPCTAAPSPCTVVMHGMFASTAAVRIS